jgi:hypothetical protein
MVTEGTITADETRAHGPRGLATTKARSSCAVPTRRTILRFGCLTDPAWAGYELDGDKRALAIKHAAFYRSVFAPSLTSRNRSSAEIDRISWCDEPLAVYQNNR